MRLRRRISHAAELKKLTYRILKNTRALEGNKKTAEIVGAVYNGQPYVLHCLSNIHVLMNNSIPRIDDHDVHGLSKRYLSMLSRVTAAAEQSINTHARFQKGILPDLLKLHTRIFNLIVERQLPVSIDSDEWTAVCLTAVAVWGDKL
jgi:hypothetical protein